MKRIQWLAIPAAFVALAACSDGTDDVNMTNIEVDATDDNMILPPADTNVDVNADINVDGTLDTNAVDNSANNTANAY